MHLNYSSDCDMRHVCWISPPAQEGKPRLQDNALLRKLSLDKCWHGALWIASEGATIEKHGMQGLCSVAVLMAADAAERGG